MSATALRWFASDTALQKSVGKAVYIFMAWNRVSKSCLMADHSFHCFVHFGCNLIYIFGFPHKHCASNKKELTCEIHLSVVQ